MASSSAYVNVPPGPSTAIWSGRRCAWFAIWTATSVATPSGSRPRAVCRTWRRSASSSRAACRSPGSHRWPALRARARTARACAPACRHRTSRRGSRSQPERAGVEVVHLQAERVAQVTFARALATAHGGRLDVQLRRHVREALRRARQQVEREGVDLARADAGLAVADRLHQLGFHGLRQARERVALAHLDAQEQLLHEQPIRAREARRSIRIRQREHDLAVVADTLQKRGGRRGEHDQTRQRRAQRRERRLLRELGQALRERSPGIVPRRDRARPSDRGARSRTGAARWRRRACAPSTCDRPAPWMTPDTPSRSRGSRESPAQPAARSGVTLRQVVEQYPLRHAVGEDVVLADVEEVMIARGLDQRWSHMKPPRFRRCTQRSAMKRVTSSPATCMRGSAGTSPGSSAAPAARCSSPGATHRGRAPCHATHAKSARHRARRRARARSAGCGTARGNSWSSTHISPWRADRGRVVWWSRSLAFNSDVMWVPGF